jgi:hypothetical protein
MIFRQKDKYILENVEIAYLKLCMNGRINIHERDYFIEYGMMEWLKWRPLLSESKKQAIKIQSPPRDELVILLTNIVEVSVDGYKNKSFTSQKASSTVYTPIDYEASI